MQEFQFQTAGRIEFGAGAIDRLPQIVAGVATPERPVRRCLFVTGKNPARSAALREVLSAKEIESEVLSIVAEPSVDDAIAGVQRARSFDADLVIAIGGGSALDAGKAVAALATNPGDPFDYLEVVGAGRPLQRPALPVIAVPTTAGTGSEVTRNAVLAASAQRVKVSLRGEYLLPRAAIVDPQLTLSCPPAVTADCGLDALTQVIEPLVSIRANPLTDGIAREGLIRSARSLLQSYRHPDDLAARTDLCFASLAGGLALANSGLGAVHGFAGPLGGMYSAPHGALCARLLPFVIQTNARILERDQDGRRAGDRRLRDAALARFQTVAALLTGQADAPIEAGVDFLFQLCADLKIQPLREFGVRAADFPAIVEKSKRSSSMRGNCLVLADEELTAILEAAC
ncbi:MAG: iron-containing alcohol dehydrogenase [bacterium]|nr:iron-containing alcohol dehydrogenase [bacterium]